MSTWALADIHGADKALKQVLERAPLKKGDTIIQLGDVADGWGEVYECVDRLLKLREDYNMIFLIGNHCQWFDHWMRFGTHPCHWLQGGEATARSYIRNATNTTDMPLHIIPRMGGYVTNLCNVDIPKSHIDFFGKQELYYIDDKNRCFVHGGFDRDLTLKENIANDPSTLFWDRDLWKKAQSCVDNQKLKTADNFSEIFIGHTHVDGRYNPDCHPITRGGVTNLDTGAGWSGKLTIMDVDTHEYWQSDLVPELYPEEHGRRN